MREPLHWCELAMPGVVRPDKAHAVLQGIASLPGRPVVVLEVRAQGGRARWRIGVRRPALPGLRSVLRAHLGDVRLLTVDQTWDEHQPTDAAQVSAPHSRSLPLRHDAEAVDQVTRQLFDVFASTGTHDVLQLQLMLGPRTTPKHAPVIDGISRAKAEARFGAYGFGCVLRIGVTTPHEGRARHLISSVAAAFRVLDVPGVSLRLRQAGRRAVHDARSPFLWPLWLSVHDLVPLMGWPVLADTDSELPGLPARHPKMLPAGDAHPRTGRPFGLAASDRQRGIERAICQRQDDALRHTHILGLNGTGKSTLLAHLIRHDLEAGRSAVVIDPKGDLVDDILARVPEKRQADIVLLDPRHPQPAGLNPLVGRDPELAADSILTVFHDLFADSWGPRTADILHGALLTLARRGDASLVMVPLLLTNPGFRRSIIQREVRKDPLGLGTFWDTFESWSDAERAQAIQPLMNKLRTVLLRPALRGIFGQRTPQFNLSDIFTKNKVLLVALGKGSIGIEGARLLGSLVTTQLWHAVLGRINQPQSTRTPVNVYIDEVQDYIAGLGDLADALATARGYSVGFTIAHQELGQLGHYKTAVLANARSRVVFQTSPADARELATGFAPGVLEREDFRALGAYQAYGQILSRNALTPWVSISTEPLPAASSSAREIRARSAAQYGSDLDAVERDLLAIIRGDRPDAQNAPRREKTTQTTDDAPDRSNNAQNRVRTPAGRPDDDPGGEAFGRRRTPPRKSKGGTQ